MGFKPTTAPPPAVKRDITKFQVFAGELLVIVPHTINEVNRNFPVTREGKPNIQTYATVFPVEDGSYKDDNGKKTTWKAGDKHYVYFTGAILRYFNDSDVDEPRVGRLVKGKPNPKTQGRAWMLEIPSEEEVEQANAVEGLHETVEEAIAEAVERRAFFANRDLAESYAKDTEEDEEDDEPPSTPWKKK